MCGVGILFIRGLVFVVDFKWMLFRSRCFHKFQREPDDIRGGCRLLNDGDCCICECPRFFKSEVEKERYFRC